MKLLKNKKVLIGVSSIFVIALIITLSLTLSKSDDNVVLSDNENNKNFINNSLLTLMLEQSDGTYQESTSNTWPSGNYAFNESLSRCENGGKLEWDREQGIVKLLSNKSDGCYVYFDLYNVVTINNVTSTKTTNSITITATVDAGENPVATYYFSIDGGRSYQESNTNTYTFSNLDYGTTYTIQVYAKDTLGYESNEETIEVTTDNYVNPVVNSVTASNITSSSITLTVNATAGSNAIQTYYYSNNNGSSYVSSNSNTYTFSGLSGNTTYNFRVYVVDSNNVNSNESIVSAMTLEPTLAELCANEANSNLLSCFVLSQYNGTQGNNNVYYHTSSLANSAGDNSYRYARANPNNYVCFGSTATTCPEDNLYRIIGVFDDEVKLIKSTDYNYYAWNSSGLSIWGIDSSVSSMLNNTFLDTFTNSWKQMITTHTWKVGGITSDQLDNQASVVYEYEVGANSSSTTYSAKIGLMYISDYGFAAGPNYWTTNLSSYQNALNTNWLYYSTEWTITRRSDFSQAFEISGMSVNRGTVHPYATDYSDAIRPTFYLNSNVTYSRGTGTSSDPVRIVI